MMRILVATDAWRPQVNGVVHTLERLSASVNEHGAEIVFLSPEGFRSAPLPTYSEIRLAFAWPREIARRIEAAKADHVHIATEGPIGWSTRLVCRRSRIPFTTSFHTRFPEYIAQRTGLPIGLGYWALRRFHGLSSAVMVATSTTRHELETRGFARLKLWSRGVDHELYRPRDTSVLDLPRPIFLYVGRVAVEKNLEALLKLDLPGSVVVVGEGPAKTRLSRAYPKAHFLGARFGEALAETYASADVFVFPSKSDTFGIVMIEAMACGLPVASFPTAAPIDVIGDSGAGVLSEDLRAACFAALEIPRERARKHSLNFTWRESAMQFLDNVLAARASPILA